MMEYRAIEFDADVENGLIKLPDEYRDFNNKHLKVFAYIQSDVEKKILSKDFFSQLQERHIAVSEDENIDEIMQSMND